MKNLGLEKDENWQLKTKAIIQYCENPRLDWEYRIITEKNIRGVRLNNIKDMLGAAKHYSPVKIDINIGNFDIALKALLQKSPEEKLKKLAMKENWQLKTQAIGQYCKELNLNWTYQIITERKIHCIRLDNIKDMLGAAKHYSPVKINIDIRDFDIMVKYD